MKGAASLVCIIFLLALGAACQAAKPDRAETALRLVERLLSEPDAAEDRRTRLFLGALPPGFDIPLSEGAEVVGGMAQGRTMTMAALDSTRPPEEVIATFQAALGSAGWKTLEFTRPVGGFQSSLPQVPRSWIVLCKDDGGWLRIDATLSSEAGATDVRAMLVQSSLDSLACEDRARLAALRPSSVFPALVPPPAVEATESPAFLGGPSGPVTRIVLLTGLAAEAIQDHYAAFLRQAGWRQLEVGSTEGTLWGLWRFADKEDREWGAVLAVSVRGEEGAGGLRRGLVTLESFPLGHSQPEGPSWGTPLTR